MFRGGKLEQSAVTIICSYSDTIPIWPAANRGPDSGLSKSDYRAAEVASCCYSRRERISGNNMAKCYRQGLMSPE